MANWIEKDLELSQRLQAVYDKQTALAEEERQIRREMATLASQVNSPALALSLDEFMQIFEPA